MAAAHGEQSEDTFFGRKDVEAGVGQIAAKVHITEHEGFIESFAFEFEPERAADDAVRALRIDHVSRAQFFH